MRIVAATTDEEMLHTIIGAQILGGTMDYRGFSNMKGFEQFRAACRAGDVQYSNLDYGFVEQAENLMLPDCAKEPQLEKACPTMSSMPSAMVLWRAWAKIAPV